MTPEPVLPTSTRFISTRALLSRIRADWQRARPGLDPSPMLTYLLLDRLHAALERQVNRTYAPAGLNPATWDLLLTLRRSSPPGGLTPTELAQLTAISGASITNRIARLLARGLIERQLSEHDRRSSRVRLSRQGLALADELLPRHLENERQIFGALGDTELVLLEELAGRLLASLESADPT
ncbi:MarR family winged helix-turn-helix transcriptional regulator [Deinococcus sp.]|uniref:MarR family winged helix-turn-helix transcriptional regulator n=1 Tax=Deinococcus sp. TaxID=47478 RepID=UPI003C7B12E9